MMNMIDNMTYHNYLVDNENYFKKVNVSPGEKFIIKHLSSDYEVTKDNDSYWIFYNNINQFLPLQGWKIHISTNLYRAEETLSALSPVLIANNVSFKHLKDQRTLYETNSKNAPRATSGKFLVIYPKDEEQFLFLLNEDL